MNAATARLDALRREIDLIDDQLHDLVMQRAEVVRRIAKAKGTDKLAVYQPAREAQLLRRLLARHHGPLPKAAVVALWRELLAAAIRLQGDYRVAVCTGDAGGVDWDLARQHFGGGAEMHALTTPAQVINAISQDTAQVGVLPLPQDDDVDPWWRALVVDDAGPGDGPEPEPPKVVARLPFAEPANGRGAGAWAVAGIDVGSSGADHSLLVLRVGDSSSRAGVQQALAEAGFEVAHHTAIDDRERAGERLHLVDLAGHVNADDARVAGVAQRLACRSVQRIGGYAAPVRLDG